MQLKVDDIKLKYRNMLSWKEKCCTAEEAIRKNGIEVEAQIKTIKELSTEIDALDRYYMEAKAALRELNVSKAIDNSRQQITAFEKQLDSLFGDQAMDISTDITVLDNMMAREGLTGGDAVHQAAQENPVADPQPELDIRNAGDAQTQPPQAEDSVDAGNGITLEL